MVVAVVGAVVARVVVGGVELNELFPYTPASERHWARRDATGVSDSRKEDGGYLKIVHLIGWRQANL